MRWSVVAAVIGGCGHGSPATDTADWPEEWGRFEEEVVDLVNVQRVGPTEEPVLCGTEQQLQGQVPLEMDDTLRKLARLHSKDMAERDFFDHVNPDGLDPFDRMDAAGFVGAQPWGENIEAGSPTPAEVVDAWMASEEHCKNIMDGQFAVIGVGLYEDRTLKYQYWWTQDFAASH